MQQGHTTATESLAASDKSHTPPNNKFRQTLSSYKFTIHTHALNTSDVCCYSRTSHLIILWRLLVPPGAITSFQENKIQPKKLDWSIDYCAHNPKEATRGHLSHMFFPYRTHTHINMPWKEPWRIGVWKVTISHRLKNLETFVMQYWKHMTNVTRVALKFKFSVMSFASFVMWVAKKSRTKIL